MMCVPQPLLVGRTLPFATDIIPPVKRARPPLVQGLKRRTGGRSGLRRAA